MPLARKSIDPMQKPIPKNPKYEDVAPTVDTGASMSKYLKKMEEFRENFRVRDDEIFKRMKLSTFVQLVLQVHEAKGRAQQIEKFDQPHQSNGFGADRNSGDNNQYAEDRPSTARSTLENLVCGIGEFETRMNVKLEGDLARPAGEGGLDLELPYLLLDLREREEFDACHIITAQSYPIAMLSRSVNFETADMLAFRNKPGRIIIVYDEDERLAPRGATTLVQRGYCNIFLLSGGLKLAWKHFPQGLIIGEMPDSIKEVLRPKKRDRSGGNGTNRSLLLGSTLSHNGLGYSVTKKPPRNTTPNLYCQLGSRDTPDGGEGFLAEDIMKLTLSLEQELDDGRSIRSGYARSTVSSARHSACVSGAGARRPFR
ncbi:hypothetical protein CRM22_007760 [Opisthorchis felineus]|uniref:Rhodanese domain-containing protein n=1 Tax=Opisthorchis felineus TaxID=147828 RepID=A0A4S2LF10_OPIFE|nr:hypothetical protein CRM22_007760 [Opisthorchis felineus]